MIAPFPPLDPERIRRRSEGSAPRTPLVLNIAPRPNGIGHPAAPPIRITSGNVFEDEWDEDVVIGGKKLPGWMDEDEGKKEMDRLSGLIADLDE